MIEGGEIQKSSGPPGNAAASTTVPSSTTGTTANTGNTGNTPPCTLAALTTAAQAAGVPNVTGLDPQGFGCSGNWAYAGVGLGGEEEVTWIFMTVDNAWQRTVVQLDCQNQSSSPTLPPSILQAACNSN